MDNFLQGNTPPLVGNGPAAASSSSSSGNIESDDIYRKADELARGIIEGIRQNEHQLSPTQREEFRQITVESLRPYTIPAVKRIEARMEEMEQIEQLFKTDVKNSDPESNNASDAGEDPSDSTSTSSEASIEPADEDEDTSEPEEDDDRLAYVIPSRYYFIPNYRFGNITRIKRNMQELQESLTEEANPRTLTAVKEDIKDLFDDINKEQDELKTLYRDMKANINKRCGDALFLLQDISQFDAIQLEALRHERAFVLAAASQHGRVLENASTAFKNDREVVLAAVKINGVILDFLSETFKNDREVVLEAVKQNGLALKYAGAGLKKDREVVLTAVRQNGRALEHANGEFKNDHAIVLEAIQKDEYAFQHASKILKRNRNFVLEAVKVNGKALLYVNEEFKSDEEIVMAAVQSNGNALPHVKGTLKNDRKVVIAAVKSNGEMLSHTSKKFKNDREVVLEAVKTYGLALKSTNEALKSDRAIALAAVSQNGLALAHVSEAMQTEEMVMTAVSQNGLALAHVSEENKTEAVVMAAVSQNGLALAYVSEAMQTKEVVLTAVSQNGLALAHVSEENKTEKVVMAAVSQNGLALAYVSEVMQTEEVVMAAVVQNELALEHASEAFKNDKELVLAIVGKNGLALEYADKALKSDKQVILRAVRQNGLAIAHAYVFRDDKEVVLEAVKQNRGALHYVSAEIQQEVHILQQYIDHVSQAKKLLIELQELKNELCQIVKAQKIKGLGGLTHKYISNFENDYSDEALATYFANCGSFPYTEREKHFVKLLRNRNHAAFSRIMQKLGQTEPISKQDFVEALHETAPWDDIISAFHFTTKPILLTWKDRIDYFANITTQIINQSTTLPAGKTTASASLLAGIISTGHFELNQRLLTLEERIAYITPMILKAIIQSTPHPLGKTMQLTSMQEIQKRIHKLTLAIEDKLQQPILMLTDSNS
jgi:hypothetical protein